MSVIEPNVGFPGEGNKPRSGAGLMPALLAPIVRVPKLLENALYDCDHYSNTGFRLACAAP